MKDCIKKMLETLIEKIRTFCEWLRMNFGLIAFFVLSGFSGFLILGSIGAYEYGDIETLQYVLQLAVGFLLIAVLILYAKYQITKEEKAELLEELEEKNAKENGVYHFELFK